MEVFRKVEKSQVYKKEYEKLSNIFKDVEDNQRELVQGLIEDAAFLYAENHGLKEIMKDTGMVKVHPTNKSLQKTFESSKQFLKNVNTYATVIKTLNSILNRNAIEEDDAFDKWIKEKQQAK